MPKRPSPLYEAHKDVTRTQELERGLFPQLVNSPCAQLHEGQGPPSSTLPTPTNRHTQQQQQQQQQAPFPPKTAGQKGSKSPHRARHLNAIHFGFNPLNPFESVVEAAPAMRHLQPHDWCQLELELPPGCCADVLQELKAELSQHISTNTSLIGARVSCTPPHRPLAYGSSPPINAPSSLPPPGALASCVSSENQAGMAPRARSRTANAGSVAAAPSFLGLDERQLPMPSKTDVAANASLGSTQRPMLPAEAAAAATAQATAASPRSQRPRSGSRPVSTAGPADCTPMAQQEGGTPPSMQLPQVPLQCPDIPEQQAGSPKRGGVSGGMGAPGGWGGGYLPPSTPAGGVNGPRTPLTCYANGAGARASGHSGPGLTQPWAQSSALQPAGIGSGGNWAARRGVGRPAALHTASPFDAWAGQSGSGFQVQQPSPAATFGGRCLSPAPAGSQEPSAAPSPAAGGLWGPGQGAYGHKQSEFVAGYGPGTTAAGVAAAGGVLPAGTAPGGPPVTLGALVSERQSVRRQAQLIADWMEAAVARVWQRHAGLVNELGMRAAFAGKQGSPLPNTRLGASQPNGAVFSSSLPKDQAYVWHQELQSSYFTDSQGSAQQCQQPQWLPDPQTVAPGLQKWGSEHSAGYGPQDMKHRSSMQGRGAPPFADPQGLQHALSVLMGGCNFPGKKSMAQVEFTSEKQSLAARFASFVQGSMVAAQQGDKAMAKASLELWREMLQVISAAGTALVRHVGEGCFEEGALLSRLWNLHSSLLTSGMDSAHSNAMSAEMEAEHLRSQIKRLDPLIDWDKAAQQELVTQRVLIEEQGASLHLASAERDGLLRENDKIIAHCKKELRRVRHEQRRGAWRLAKKLKNTQDQLVLLQRDRQSLLDAVMYTRGQAFDMVVMVASVNKQFQRLQQNHQGILESEGFSMADLFTIEVGLRNMAATASRVQEVNKEAEDQHFQMEEQVTAVAANDDYGDDEVEAIMAGGDPDKPQEQPASKVQSLPTSEISFTSEEERAKQEEQRPAEDKEKEAQAIADAVTAAEAARAQAQAEQEVAAAEKKAKEEAAAVEAEARAQEDAAAEAIKEEAPGAKTPPSQSSSSKFRDRESQTGQQVSMLSRAQSIAVSVHDVGMQTMPTQTPVMNDPREDELRIQDLLKAREQELAQRLMLDFGIEMDPALLQAQMRVTSSRASSPEGTESGRSLVGHAYSYADQSRMGRMHGSDDELESPLRRAQTQRSRMSPESSRRRRSQSQGDPDQPSLLQLVVLRMQEKMEEMQESVQAAASAKLSSSIQDLKSAQEQLNSFRMRNYEPEAQLKDARWSPASTKQESRHDADDDIPSLPSPAEPKAAGIAERGSKDKEKEKGKGKDRDNRDKRGRPETASAQKNLSLKGKGGKWKRHVTSPDGTKPRDTATPPQDKHSRSEAFVLGRERTVEKKEQQSGSARLEDAIAKYTGIKPRTPDWLLKLIDGIYRGKMGSEEMRAKMIPPQEPIPLVDYMFQHLAGVYGTSALINQYAAQLVATIRANQETDTRVRVFKHFLMEDRWPRKVLSVFLDALRRLGEPARLPCCDFPADWSGVKKGGHPIADVRKCLWVSDKVLMRRHTKTAYSFAARLALKGEPIPEAELAQYFVAPGYYGQELQQILEYERGRAEFRKIPTHVFLEALCDEYTRCETVFMEVLPALHKKWDGDADGFLKPEDVTRMMKHMAPQGTEDERLESETQSFWLAAYRHEMGGVEQGLAGAAQASSASFPDDLLAPATAGSVVENEGMVGIEAFVAVAQHNNFIRHYVRLHKTPPARKESNSLTGEARARLLLRALIQNYWKLHGNSLMEIFPCTNPSVEVLLQQQVDKLVLASDGSRMAIALHGLFKMLIGRKLDSMVSQLPSENTGTHQVADTFSADIERLTTAIKVLYGADVLVADDIKQRAHEFWNPKAVHTTVGRMKFRFMGDALRTYNALRSPMCTHAMRFLSAHPTFMAFCSRHKSKTSPVSSMPQASSASSLRSLKQASKSTEKEETADFTDKSGSLESSPTGSGALSPMATEFSMRGMVHSPSSESNEQQGTTSHSSSLRLGNAKGGRRKVSITGEGQQGNSRASSGRAGRFASMSDEGSNSQQGSRGVSIGSDGQ